MRREKRNGRKKGGKGKEGRGKGEEKIRTKKTMEKNEVLKRGKKKGKKKNSDGFLPWIEPMPGLTNRGGGREDEQKVALHRIEPGSP